MKFKILLSIISNRFIWHIDGTQTDSTTLDQSGPGSNEDEGVTLLPRAPLVDPHHRMQFSVDICHCLPPDRTWHEVNYPKVDYRMGFKRGEERARAGCSLVSYPKYPFLLPYRRYNRRALNSTDWCIVELANCFPIDLANSGWLQLKYSHWKPKNNFHQSNDTRVDLTVMAAKEWFNTPRTSEQEPNHNVLPRTPIF